MSEIISSLFPALFALIPIGLLFFLVFKEKKKREQESKSPFRKKLYRLPGEFAQQKAAQHTEKGEEALTCLMVSAAIAFLIILLSKQSEFFAFSLLAILFLSSIHYIRSLHANYAEARKWRLGYLGERVVGDYLMREFLPHRMGVYHDVQQDKAFHSNPFNYDHILLDHRGVFLVETKTRSKKTRTGENPNYKLTLTKETITFPDGYQDHDTIPKLIKQAQELGDQLTEQFNSNIPVYPILVYPGWSIQHGETTSKTPLCDPLDLSKRVLKESEKALSEDTQKRLKKWFEEQSRDIDNSKL